MSLNEQYSKQEDSIRKSLNLLESKINSHRVDFNNNPDNWGYVADLVHIEKSLKDIIDFIRTK